MERIELPRSIVNQILTQAQQSAELEVCGLIGAKNGLPFRCYRVDNVAADPTHRYQMDPKQQIDAMRKMRDNGESLFAIYHSHPDGPARPSSIDIEQAAYPDAYYLIVSMNTQGVLEMRGFRLAKNDVTDIDIDLA